MELNLSHGAEDPTPATTTNHLKSRNFGWFTFLQKSLKSAFSNELYFFYKKVKKIPKCAPKGLQTFWGVFVVITALILILLLAKWFSKNCKARFFLVQRLFA